MPVIPCAPVVPVTGIVVFDASIFIDVDHYSEFAAVPPGQLNFNFIRAQLLLNNTCGSRVQDANQRETLLDLITAHLTELTNGANGQPPAGMVGRISDAAEGSVNVTAEYSTAVSESEAFWIQTKYGALYWQAIAAYRTMVYLAAPVDAYIGGPYVATSYGPGGNGGCGYNGGSS